MRKRKCLRCDAAMKFDMQQKFQMGQTSFLLGDWPNLMAGALELETVALVHTGAAFAMLVFIIAHVYMTTMGKTLTSHIKPMITGYEDQNEHH